jgi:predicted translin family RNA/ssDNA-binding protein
VVEIESGSEAYRETISFVPDIPEMSAEEIRSLEKERLPEAITFFEKASSELEALKNETPEGISLDMARALKEYCEIAAAENKILAAKGAYNLLYLEEFPETEPLKKSISATEKHLQIVTLRLSQLEEINLLKRHE